MERDIERLAFQLEGIPHQSGVYRFLNKEGVVIYVGKAKDLKKRVSQYFQSTRNHTRKTLRMVSQIVSIEYTIVASESDAFLLENNLIKTIKPKYNILLKDDKTYPWICVKNEPFPRVFTTRRKVNDKSLYFGPYTNGMYCKQLLTLIHTLYPLRTCAFSLTDSQIEKKKYKKCLQYHIGQCHAPCEGLETEDVYKAYIEAVISLLKGQVAEVKKTVELKMKEAANHQDFELAQRFKEQREALDRYQKHSVIVSPQLEDIDVFSLVMDNEQSVAYGNFMRVCSGAVIQSQNVVIKLRIEEEPERVLSLFLASIQEQQQGLAKEVVVPFMPEASPSQCNVHVPKIGDKKELVTLSLRNAQNYRKDQVRLAQKMDPSLRSNRRTSQLMEQMKLDLGMSTPPVHIECFDNSNLQGTNPVASCVVFRDGKPYKKDYRHFNIKTVVGANDFASMEEVVTRRYTRLLDEATQQGIEPDLPQLVVIDGGKGQLSAAYKAMCNMELQDKIYLIGLAKRLEEIYKIGEPLPLFLDKNSPTLRVIMHLRDEAHRFGITFHRQKRSTSFIHSSLTDIPGIGEVTAAKLLAHFKSIKQLKGASYDEIEKVVGKAAAKKWIASQGTGS